jgi:hypothetical protein
MTFQRSWLVFAFTFLHNNCCSDLQQYGGFVLSWWGGRRLKKTLKEQIQRSGSILMCNKQQLNTLFRGSLPGSKVY